MVYNGFDEINGLQQQKRKQNREHGLKHMTSLTISEVPEAALLAGAKLFPKQ